MSEEKKKIILWLSVSIITVIIVIIWGFFLKQNLFSLKIKLQQKKEPDSKNLQLKENLEELKKSLEGFKQGVLDVKTMNNKPQIIENSVGANGIRPENNETINQYFEVQPLRGNAL